MKTAFIDTIKTINSTIAALQKQKEQIVSANSTEILNGVLQMMDWRIENIQRHSVAYSSFEQRIMIEVYLKKDPDARYVFELNGKGEISLRFREVLRF